MIQGERNNNIDCTTTIKLIRHFVYYTKHNNSNELFLMSNSILEFFIEISVINKISDFPQYSDIILIIFKNLLNSNYSDISNEILNPFLKIVEINIGNIDNYFYNNSDSFYTLVFLLKNLKMFCKNEEKKIDQLMYIFIY